MTYNMKLSIITINYNNLEGLRKTIDSVLCQTWKDFEWIFIDGGSTDGSKELIEKTATECPQVSYWCSEPDKGVYNAQNKGIQHAAGEYVVFMNSGDQFAYPTTLQLVFGNEREADIIFGYMMRRTLDGMPHNIPSMKSKLYWEDFYFDTIPHQSSYIRKSLFEMYGNYDESYSRLADWKWFCNVVNNHNVSLEFLPEKLSIYECDGISEDEYMKEELRRLRNEMFPDFIASQDFERIRETRKILSHPFSRYIYRLSRKIAFLYDQWHAHRQLKNARS